MDAIAIELNGILRVERSKINNKKNILQNLVFFVIVCSLFFFISHFVVGVAVVNGTSMGATVKQSSIIFYNKLAKSHSGDIIVAKRGNSLLVKRQIATGGQTVDIVDGKVSVDGNFLTETYLSSEDTHIRDVAFPYTVPDRQIFILGDNRAASVDSRNSQIGSIDEDDIVGKVMLIN